VEGLGVEPVEMVAKAGIHRGKVGDNCGVYPQGTYVRA
jgi:hypothetical protein